MITFFVGQIDEVKPVNRKNKETGQVTTNAQVTATFETKDNEGYLVKTTEQIQMDMSDFGKLQTAKGKYIVVPYMTLNTQKGTFTFPDDAQDYTIMDKSPFEVKKAG